MLLARDSTIQITDALLLVAAERGKGELLEMLLARDPTIQITDALLLVAAEGGGKEILEMLLARAPTVGELVGGGAELGSRLPQKRSSDRL